MTVDFVPVMSPIDAVAPGEQSNDYPAPSEVPSSGTGTIDTQESSTSPDASSGPAPATTESNSDELDDATGPDLRARAFVVLGQDYAPELIQIALPAPTRVQDALARVSSARRPRDRFCLPYLLPVVPQPSGNHALLLALPPWPVEGAYIACDLSAHDGRTFALHIGTRTDRAGLLIAVGIADGTGIEIYIRDMPWALVDGVVAELGHGDLVQFVPEHQAVAVVSTLADMLASPTHWRYVAPALTLFLGDTWVVHDDGAFRHQVRPERRSFSRHDVAARLGILPSDLVIQMPQPRIHDFWRRGQPTMHVMYAVWAPGCATAGDLHEAVCFIDLRPVLCGLYVARCQDYCLDVCELLTRFARRCPAGLQVQAERQGALLPPFERALPVNNGDVITVFVLPDSLTRDWGRGGGGPPGHPPPPDHPSRVSPGITAQTPMLQRRPPITNRQRRRRCPAQVVLDCVTRRHGVLALPHAATAAEEGGFLCSLLPVGRPVQLLALAEEEPTVLISAMLRSRTAAGRPRFKDVFGAVKGLATGHCPRHVGRSAYFALDALTSLLGRLCSSNLSSRLKGLHSGKSTRCSVPCLSTSIQNPPLPPCPFGSVSVEPYVALLACTTLGMSLC